MSDVLPLLQFISLPPSFSRPLWACVGVAWAAASTWAWRGGEIKHEGLKAAVRAAPRHSHKVTESFHAAPHDGSPSIFITGIYIYTHSKPQKRIQEIKMCENETLLSCKGAANMLFNRLLQKNRLTINNHSQSYQLAYLQAESIAFWPATFKCSIGRQKFNLSCYRVEVSHLLDSV